MVFRARPQRAHRDIITASRTAGATPGGQRARRWRFYFAQFGLPFRARRRLRTSDICWVIASRLCLICASAGRLPLQQKPAASRVAPYSRRELHVLRGHAEDAAMRADFALRIETAQAADAGRRWLTGHLARDCLANVSAYYTAFCSGN